MITSYKFPQATTDGAGAATVTSERTVTGQILALGVSYGGAPAAGTDVTVRTKGNNGPSRNILVITNGNTNLWSDVRVPVKDDTNANITYDGIQRIHDAPSVDDVMEVVVAQAGAAGKTVDVFVIFEEGR